MISKQTTWGGGVGLEGFGPSPWCPAEMTQNKQSFENMNMDLKHKLDEQCRFEHHTQTLHQPCDI